MILTKIPDFVEGEKCWCRQPAFQKVEVVHDKNFKGHSMNAYVCKEHFYMLMRGCSEEQYIQKLEKAGARVFKDTDFM